MESAFIWSVPHCEDCVCVVGIMSASSFEEEENARNKKLLWFGFTDMDRFKKQFIINVAMSL